MTAFKLKLKEHDNENERFNDALDGLLKNGKEEVPVKENVLDLKHAPKKKKTLKKKSNKYFYRVSNHHELFKIGRSFYEDYQAGVKSFAITSTGYQTSQQKTILGLASFFDHKEDLKIGIISDNLSLGAFKDIVGLSKKVNYDYFGEDHSLEIHSFYNHFEFINLEDILALSGSESLEDSGEVIDHIVDLYDIVFWDVPELHKIQVDAEGYIPIIMKYESISIIVAQALSKKSDIEEMKKFFLGYGINLKGLLLEEKSSLSDEAEVVSKKVEKKRPWWGLFSK